MTAGGLKRRQGVLDAASQTCFTGSESNVRHSGGVRGGPLSGDFWSRIRWWKSCGERKSLGTGVYQPEDPWEGRERLLVYQPEDPVARGPVGGERTASCDPWEVREQLFRSVSELHRLILRVPKATLTGRKRKEGRA